MYLLDLSHTAHTRARTGIQRVARQLQAELTRRQSALPVTWDPYAGTWRGLDDWETANLQATQPRPGRGAKWPWSARWQGRWRRWRRTSAALPANQGLIVPELFSPAVAAAFDRIPRSGPRIALFHDAIALQHPELTPPVSVGRFPAYLQELLQFDGIAAVSEDSRQTLADYWRWLGVASCPPVVAIPLGLTAPDRTQIAHDPFATQDAPVVLCVGSIEGRKNHLALLEACERLWQQDEKFNLRLIGLAQPQTGRQALARIRQLQAAGRPLRYDGAVDEVTLEEAYATCTFTVYPSLKEGFGLPVLESVARGKPCVCSAHGALGESTRGGGCLPLAVVTPDALAAAIAQLLTEPGRLAALIAEAQRRPIRTWADYTSDLLAWIDTSR